MKYYLNILLLLMILISACNQKKPSEFSIISYNVWNGFEGEEQRRNRFKEWAKEQDADVIAFQELNDFTQQSFSEFAGQWNHPYAVILKETGYPVGISSRYPVEVVDKVIENMHHGYLVVKTGGIRFCIVHLSPFSSIKRQEEAHTIVRALSGQDPSVSGTVILGDFNAYSASDSVFYNTHDRLSIVQGNDSAHEVHQNLNVNGRLDYSVMDIFEQAGFRDAHDLLGLPFGRSFPTNVFDGIPTDQGKERIDHILLSSGLQSRLISEQIIHDEVTDTLSDHYPVIVKLGPE